MSKLTNLNYGKEDLIKEDLDIKKAKIRITTMIDQPIYEHLKKEANKKGVGYQTLINMILAEHIETGGLTISDLAKELNNLTKKVNKIEKGKKSA
jgi:predicted DNA binding CopG/RHH family protein